MAKKLSSGSADQKVFIVEDHPVFRQGLIQMLAGERGLTVVGFAADAAAALKSITE
jgi:DNA-binding NarL/FixJ family response regulator